MEFQAETEVKNFLLNWVPGHAHELGVAPRDVVRHDGLFLEGVDDALQQLSARGRLVFGRVVPTREREIKN